MKGTAEFHHEARQYFETHFGPGSERAGRYQTVYDPQTEGAYIHAVAELRQAEVENILSAQHLDHPVQR